jgi:SAM-dependent methyltransferase
MAAACAAVADDDEPEPLRPQKTCYEVNGVTLSVDGFAYRQDPRGGNLSAHGKATGEAFWPASRLLMDYLVRDCELLKGDAPRRVVELGCGLGLAGLVAATMLGATKGSEVVLTDGDAGVVARARASANNARGKTAPVSCVEHRWGEPHALGRFDVVLAAEVLYDPNVALESSNALAKSCDSLLADGGVVLVAFERRGVDLQVLIDAFAAFGFDGAPAPCTDGAYEDIFEERQDEPSMLWHRCLMAFTRRPPFVDLTDCVSEEDLAAVSEELGALGVFGSELGDIDVSVFAAESQKYGDALELADRDTSCWCADSFVSRGPVRNRRPYSM